MCQAVRYKSIETCKYLKAQTLAETTREVTEPFFSDAEVTELLLMSQYSLTTGDTQTLHCKTTSASTLKQLKQPNKKN